MWFYLIFSIILELQYEKKLFISSVQVYETYHPGSICALYGFSYRDSKWVKVWSIFENSGQIFKTNYEALERKLPPRKSRKFILDIEKKMMFTELIRFS